MGALQDDPVEDATELAFVAGAAVRDIAHLVGLESRLVLRTIVVMLVLAVFLAFIVISVWCSFAVAIGVVLYEYTVLNLTGSVLLVAVLNLVLGAAVAVVLRRMARRLRFPETREAIRSLWSAGASPEGGEG